MSHVERPSPPLCCWKQCSATYFSNGVSFYSQTELVYYSFYSNMTLAQYCRVLKSFFCHWPSHVYDSIFFKFSARLNGKQDHSAFTSELSKSKASSSSSFSSLHFFFFQIFHNADEFQKQLQPCNCDRVDHGEFHCVHICLTLHKPAQHYHSGSYE